jgi:8-amino-7-oxononanoate synthase
MTGPLAWADVIDARLEAIRAAGRWRAHRTFDALGPRGTWRASGPDGVSVERDVVAFASNDYLGLTTHPAVRAGAEDAIARWGTGAGASRLVTGDRPVHVELEAELAAWKGTERAVLFPTGFAANLGVLATLGASGVHIISEELNHASIIDGTRLARASTEVWRHGDLDHLAELLARAAGSLTLVVADAVFSMDGDALDVEGVADLCRAHGALLVLDEAHLVLGPEPDPSWFDGLEVVRVGTLSKAIGSLGGFATCSNRVADLLVNTARTSIFTTGLSPADAGAALAAVHIVRSAEGDDLRARLRRHVDRLRPAHPSPIVPIILGDEQRALDASAALLDAGLLVPAIRPPTVAPGTSRLRVTLSAAHTDAEVDQLVTALAHLTGAPP